METFAAAKGALILIAESSDASPRWAQRLALVNLGPGRAAVTSSSVHFSRSGYSEEVELSRELKIIEPGQREPVFDRSIVEAIDRLDDFRDRLMELGSDIRAVLRVTAVSPDGEAVFSVQVVARQYADGELLFGFTVLESEDAPR
jgi:hypothetical protein